MTRKNYNDMILNRVEKNFDKLMPYCVIASLASAVTVYYSDIPRYFITVDILLGAALFIISLFRQKLSAEFKIISAITLAAVIGIMSFLDRGFISGGMNVLMISIAVAVMLLSWKKSIVMSLISIAIFIGLWVATAAQTYEIPSDNGTVVWIIQFIIFLLYLLILNTLVYTIRRYLLDNIRELEDSVDSTYRLAYYDQLTGLPNLAFLKTKLEKKEATSKIKGHLVCFNLKNLNMINSIYSSDIGNLVLIEVAEVFNRIKKENEFVAHVRGNEFAFWIENLDELELEKRLEQIKVEFYKQFKVPYMTIKIEFFSSYIKYDSKTTIDDFYHKANLALTYAKTHNISEVVAYDQELDDVIRYDESLKEQLEKAIMQKDFDLYYQNKVDAVTMLVVGVEALARWKSKSNGIVEPDLFVPIIEKMNLTIPFGEMIITKALGEYEGLSKKFHENLKLSLNISPTHLISDSFVSFLGEAILDYDINPERIILEITEEIMLEGDEAVKDTIRQLKLLGVAISLDDFGSGYSSLNHLSTLDIDELKIDKAFINQIGINNKIVSLLKTIINLSKEYDLELVAEGVETKEQCNLLIKLGCQVIQGYYFSKPEPL